MTKICTSFRLVIKMEINGREGAMVKRSKGLLICALFIAIILLFEKISIHSSDHHCEEHSCVICAQMEITKKVLKQLLVIFSGAIIIGSLFLLLIIKYHTCFIISTSLVKKKVRMDR